MGAVAARQVNRETLRANEKKWGLPLLRAGWCLVPATLLERQQALGLDAIDLNIVLHLVRYWWYADQMPYPSKGTIAEAMGIHPSTVQRRIRKLEAAEFLKRRKRFDKERGQRSNEYDLSGLVRAATPYAKELLEERAERERNDSARRRRKRLKLSVVSAPKNPR